jgi:hypothetical protein
MEAKIPVLPQNVAPRSLGRLLSTQIFAGVIDPSKPIDTCQVFYMKSSKKILFMNNKSNFFYVMPRVTVVDHCYL